MLKSRLRLFPSLAFWLLVACQGDAPIDSPEDGYSADPTRATGALHVSSQVQDPSVDRVAYRTTTRGFDRTGTLAVMDGVAEGQIQVPEGSAFDVELRFFAGDVERCEGRANQLAVEPGRTSQVNILPHCDAVEANTDRSGKRNRAPRIEAVFASRRNVRVGESVALSVSASDTDGDRLRYQWTESVAGSGFADARAAATSWKAGPRAITLNTLRVTVSDGRGGAAQASLDMNFDGLVLTPGTCEEPTAIHVGDSVRGLTFGAPSEHAGSCFMGPPPAAPENVFKLELTEPQDVSISVVGSAFFARIYVRRDACESPEAEVVCGQTQRVELPNAKPGTYFVFVDSDEWTSQGEYMLHVFSGTQPEVCGNFVDDDEDGFLDCADSDCADQPGCLDCAFECDVNPNDCFAGLCQHFSGQCSAFFVVFGVPCDSDGDPQTNEICDGHGLCIAPVCGNGIIEVGEECDDGNAVDGDGCDHCVVVAVCGNGSIELGEDCDDGNTVGGDGCEADCRAPAGCGNGRIEGDEECDDGNTIPIDGCDPTCRIEHCNEVVCDDGNPCTENICVDVASATCGFLPLPNGTPCEFDGTSDALEQCQGGFCMPPIPDQALMILDPEVLADPAFSLRAMHDRLAPNGEGAEAFERWAASLTVDTTINGRTAAARAGFTAFFNGLPRDVNGRVDLDQAGFLPTAFVNRFDLRTPGNCGENRLAFAKASGVENFEDRMTILFEFNIPDDGSDCRNAVARWTALRALRGDALRVAVATLLEQIALPLELNTLRSNEFVQAQVWELREFHLLDGQFVAAPVADSVPPVLSDDPTFRSFVVENAVALNHGARERGMIPTHFLDASSLVNGQTLRLGNIVPALPGLESNLNILSCAGCHINQTATPFVHIQERKVDEFSMLSSFLRSDLEFRSRTLEAFLTP